MTISVLIATCGRAALLEKCLHSILNSDLLPQEIVVIDQSDNSSVQSLLSTFKSKNVNLRSARMKRNGKSVAINRAIEMSTGDYLAFTDDDVSVDGRWLSTFANLHKKNPHIQAFCGRVLPDKGLSQSAYINLVLGNDYKWINSKSDPVTPGFCGANMIVNRETILRVGKLNENFGPGSLFRSNDDGELAFRLRTCS